MQDALAARVFLMFKVDRLVDHVRTCLKSDRSIVSQLLSESESYVARRPEKIHTSDVRSKEERERHYDALNNLLVNFISVHGLPFDILSSQELKNLFLRVGPSYKLPSRKKFANKLLPNQEIQIDSTMP